MRRLSLISENCVSYLNTTEFRLFFICNLYTLVPVEAATCAKDGKACDANTNDKTACFKEKCVGK